VSEFKCKLDDFVDEEAHAVSAYMPAHAAVLYAQWSDQQAGEGYSESQVVCVWVDGAWQRFTVTARRQVEYSVEGFRTSRAVTSPL
jgi:hypothetical protein